MPLSDVAIRKAKPADKTQRLFDGGGLYLELAPSGGKWWRLKYRFGGKEKRLSLGTYPDTSLSDARAKRDEARKLLAAGVDPSLQRKAEKAALADRTANTFGAIALEFVAKREKEGLGEKSALRARRWVTKDIAALRDLPITDLTASVILSALRKLEQRGVAETAHRARGFIGQVFRYAIATDRAERNPAADLVGALEQTKTKHFASITDPAKIGELLRAIDAYTGSAVTVAALKLAPLTFVRPGELRTAQWSNIDLEAAEWRYTATKTQTPHIVPLSAQAVEILRELRLLTGRGQYVFPGVRSPRRPMSENTVNAALRYMGFDRETMSGHGFRAMARTVLDEVLHFRPDYIEHQLAHAVRDPNGRAYNRTAHLAERTKMMQAWANYLDGLRVCG
ncbi:tyrosine-type recombinase/integrase [Dyella lutea]|uniref:Integrase arm-type DNA-binding domain-containing protein n=1 Tax=Dyella lutea TaxID=2950441 RepID=A0ABT1F5G6_9GAMM|nr:integrase arm-type DNA-binding domain-containing protein [Dyella lutea]MCP1372623.1 integrase arm-type DNA-binding domain-containing protein [Dyella lutea]